MDGENDCFHMTLLFSVLNLQNFETEPDSGAYSVAYEALKLICPRCDAYSKAMLNRRAYSSKYDILILKLSEFVVFNVGIIIYAECYSSTLFA